MKEIRINCAGIEDEAGLLTLFAKTLNLSANSLETLYDGLTAIDQETHVAIFGLNELAFADTFRTTLQDAETDNFWLNISLQ